MSIYKKNETILEKTFWNSLAFCQKAADDNDDNKVEDVGHDGGNGMVMMIRGVSDH